MIVLERFLQKTDATRHPMQLEGGCHRTVMNFILVFLKEKTCFITFINILYVFNQAERSIIAPEFF